MSGLTLTLSTLNVSSINNSAPGVSAYSTLNVSTLNAVSSITVLTLTVSSINGGAPGIGNASAYSMLNVSSLNAVSTLTTSSINVTTGTVGIGTANPSAAGYVWRVGSASTGSGGAGNFYIHGASSGNSGVKMVINPSGYVGIGITNPTYPLTVYGQIGETPTGYVFNSNGPGGSYTNTNVPTSIWAQYTIVSNAYGFFAVSDKRVKKDIVTLTNCLSTISKLRPVQYKYTDALKNNPYKLVSLHRK